METVVYLSFGQKDNYAVVMKEWSIKKITFPVSQTIYNRKLSGGEFVSLGFKFSGKGMERAGQRLQ